MSVLGQLAKVAKAKPLRSTLDEAVEALARPKGTGAEYLKELEKTKGVKPTEIKERGIDKVLANMPKVNKEKIVKAIQSKANPPIEEKILGAGTHKELSTAEENRLKMLKLDYRMQGEVDPAEHSDFVDLLNRQEKSTNLSLTEKTKDLFEKFNEARENGQNRLANQLSSQLDLINDRQQRLNKVLENPTKYGEYTLPNGENYREILLKLPEKVKYDLEGFRSSHFNEPNILAHMRVSDRTGPNGEKVLHLEELQSDWHQQGREHGYRQNLTELPEGYKVVPYTNLLGAKDYHVLDENGKVFASGLNPETATENALGNLNKGNRVPDAPFKKNWHEVALKKLMNYATENGYDRLAITPGSEQAKRYDLSKQVDELLYKQNSDGTYQLSAQAQGRGNMMGDAIPPDKLENYVGKEVAQKIINNRGQERNLGGSGSVSQPKDVWGSLSGEGLQVGGEGMKGFYDKILPDYLNKLGSPHGAQVKMHGMPSSPQLAGEFNNMLDHADLTPDMFKALPVEQQQKITSDWTQKTSPSLHTFDLTPSLKNEITQKGLPLYQQIGIPLVGAEAINETQPEPERKRGGSVSISSNPDTMFMELADRRLAGGGAITKLTKLLAEAPELTHTVRGLYKAEAPELSGLIDKVQTPARQSVIPMPNRWFTKPKENPHVQPLVEKVLQVNNMKREDFHSGAFVDPKTGLILDNQIHNDVGVAIDPITNRPVMTSGGVTGMESLPKDQGSFTNSNLLKQGKYKPTGGDSILDELGFIATVDKAGMGHAYGLGTDYATPVLLNNLGTGNNPTLRPRSVGDVFGVGDVVGQMQINKNSPVHDVYEKLLVAPKGSDVEGVKLNKAKGGAVQSLKTNLPALPKTDYHSIDKLMSHISKEFNIHPKKLHDDFVAKYHRTPDDWIKKGHYKKYGLGGIVKALTPMEEALAKMRALKQAMKPEIDLSKRYEEATKDMYTKDMPSFEEWKKTLPPPEVK
jgi:hypothetical protein